MKYYTVIFILVSFILYMVDSQSEEGDACTTNNDKTGVCRNFRSCSKARDDIRRGVQPKICSYQGIETIICCPEDRPINTPPPPTPSTPVIIPTKIEQCAFPKDAIKVERRNQKAWDKCIDLAENIWPCKRLGTTRLREDTCKHKVKQLVLGGVAAAENEFPHMAALGYESAETSSTLWDCGGTLISEQWVMTAAHCSWNKNTNSEVKHVRLGGGDINVKADPKYLFEVIQIVRHPDYIGTRTYNDIALLKLNRQVKYSIEMRPACLYTGETVNDNKAIAIGYGATENFREKSNVLLKVVLDKFSHEDCSAKHPPLRRSPDGIRKETQICFGSSVINKDTCQGDSGGPLQIYNNGVHCTYYVIGITSTGKECGVAGLPAIYTRVSAFIPWIESVVWP